MIYVDFFGIVDSKQQKIARLMFDGNKLFWESCKNKAVEEIINDEIYVDDKEIYPEKDPELFIRNLYKHYSGTYLRAGKPKIGK